MNVVALGRAASKIADCFNKYPVYKIYKLDENIEDGKFSKSLKSYASPEEYEQKCPSLKKFFKTLENDEVLFICVGSSPITGCSLRVLEQLQDKKITILYVRPDLSLLNDKPLLQERTTFNILQQYARSGLFEKMYLIDNLVIEQILGEIPITQYYDRLNDLISSTFHMINVYKRIAPVFETHAEIPEVAKIATLGIRDTVSGEDKFFYPLQYKTNQKYYYAFNKEILERDGKIFQNIKKQMKEKNEINTKTSFSIYATDYKENFIYCECFTHFIQEEKIV